MDSLILGLRVLLSLGAVFGLMWLLHKRLSAGKPGLRARAISVVARQNVGPKASVVLLDTEDSRFLLGVTEHGINVLHTSARPVPSPGPHGAGDTGAVDGTGAVVPDPDHDAAAGEDLNGEDLSGDASFAAQLRSQRVALGKPGPAGQSATGAEAGTDPLAGSVLDPATWRRAMDAIRAGRRP